MADKTKIEWADATWNPLLGCRRVSAGCEHCYAEAMAARFSGPDQWGEGLAGMVTRPDGRREARWTGATNAQDHKLGEPLRWRRPRRIFVCSTSDLFYEGHSIDRIDRVFAVMALAPQHQFLVLTKRPDRMRVYCSNPETPFRIAKEMDALEVTDKLGPEEIRPIAGYDGYFASSHGFIFSEKRGDRRRMKPDTGEHGHMRIQLHRDAQGSRRGDRFLVHRIILETFVGPAPTKDAQGRHRDGNPRNNALANLSWGDQGENWLDSKRHGSHRRYFKLSAAQADEIRRRHAAGDTGESLAREFDVSATQIRNIASGRQWSVEAPIRWPLSTVWLGVSVEDQAAAKERIPVLLDTPAAIRFISAEPLLGQLRLNYLPPSPEARASKGVDCLDGLTGVRTRFGCGSINTSGWTGPAIDWVICGGESGPGARPMHPGWARSLRDQCAEASVAFFMKQMDKKTPIPADLMIRELPNV